MTRVIVLIPHYNNTKELVKSIKSINESISVDVLIVDDGSSVDIPNQSHLQQIYKHGKIILDILPENQGIEYALNRGLQLIKEHNYKYVGRLDCGDYCKKDRFAKQLNYLDSHADVFLLGTWVDIISADGEFQFELQHPISYENIKKKLYHNSMFVHPSVVFRTSVIDSVGYYPVNYKAAEDYAYFFNISRLHKVENYPESLLEYIIDHNSISTTKRKLQVKSRIRIILKHFKFGYYPIVGLLRNFVLYFVGRNTSNLLKKASKKCKLG